MVYYRELLNDERLTANEGILYSTLIGNLVTSQDAYSEIGKLRYTRAKNEIQEYHDKTYTSYVSMITPSTNSLIKATEMSKPTVIKTLESLRQKRYIHNGNLRCPMKILNAGYFKLPKGTKLKGNQLIFYGFLLDRGKPYNNTVDTWTSELAKLLHTSEDNIDKLVSILQQKGFIKTEPIVCKDGKTRRLIKVL